MQFPKRIPKNDGGMLFVYGSLKRGFHNHSYLQGARFFGEGRTRPEFDLVDLDEFPAMVRPGRFHVHGEIYQVNRRIRDDIDLVEGNGIFYERIAETIFTSNGEVECWLYVLIEPDTGSKPIAPSLDGATKIWRRR